ncbi:MAG: WecB/TagA/CpsF family glycosyltransferase [Hyphomicrobiales bacterium]
MPIHNLNDNLDRDVYCLMGIPVDAVDMDQALARIYDAAERRRRLFLSTANLNFVALSQRSPEFLQSLLDSDLVTPDGIGVIALGKLFGVSLPERVSGADLLEAMERGEHGGRQLKVFIFGGLEGVAERACRTLAEGRGLTCCGFVFPGFGSVEEMSDAAIIDKINASDADFVMASLGASKGQAWLMANRQRLTIPVLSHFGAAVNFVAGSVERAPLLFQKAGLEWLWRIRQEPQLWSRYASDAALMARIVSGRMLGLINEHRALARSAAQGTTTISASWSGEVRVLSLSGSATPAAIAHCQNAFRNALHDGCPVTVDLSGMTFVSSRLLGLLQMFGRELRDRQRELSIVASQSKVEKQFHLHGAGYLLDKPFTINNALSKKLA